MGKFYSDTLEDAIKLIYFQSNPARYPEGVKLLEKAVEAAHGKTEMSQKMN